METPPPNATLEEIRQTLIQFPGAERLPGDPDNEIVSQCLSLAGGSKDRLGVALREVFLAKKKPSKSWAWFPVVLGQYLGRKTNG